MAVRMNQKAPSPVTITVEGRLDAAAAMPLRTKISDHLDAGSSLLVVDLSDVDFIDSAGLAALVIGMKRTRLESGDLRLVTPAHAAAQRVFELTKFDEVFEMFDTAEGAHEGWT